MPEDFTQSNAWRFYSSKGDPLVVKGLIYSLFLFQWAVFMGFEHERLEGLLLPLQRNIMLWFFYYWFGVIFFILGTFIISKDPLWDIVSFDPSDADRTCQEAAGMEGWTINDR